MFGAGMIWYGAGRIAGDWPEGFLITLLANEIKSNLQVWIYCLR